MNQPEPILTKINNWIKQSIGLKIFTIVFLVLILLIPLEMVKDLIRERKYNQRDVTQEVSKKWGYEQTLTTLVVNIPYYTFHTITDKDDNKELIKTKHIAHFLPNDLTINGTINPEKRHRGIYDVTVYKADFEVKGNFNQFKIDWVSVPNRHIDWNQATISLGLNDLRSIQNNISLQWDDQVLNFNPGLSDHDVIETGISANFIANDSTKSTFSFHISFNGSSKINFTPLGKTTNISLKSNWADPSFEGAFLPDNHNIKDTGFVANWKVLHLNRNYPQKFEGEEKVTPSNFGVSLITPVDQYQKSTRAIKYGVMILSLTFLIYFFSQIITRIRIHPIQYLIVGLALCLFFTLLIAISEHLSFNYAYLIASTSIIIVISGYSYFIFKNSLTTMIFTGILTVLYGFIYVILQLQDYSLLIGSIGLFLTISTVMYLSRNIDWYNLNSKKDDL